MANTPFEFICNSEEQLSEISKHLIQLIENGFRIFLFRGDLGAGKTTTIKQVGKKLGIDSDMNSPTFSLVQEYETSSGIVFFHMDLYRLNHLEDLEQIGFLDYLDSGAICMIEWPQLATPLLDIPRVEIDIETSANNIRKFVIASYDTVDA